MSFYEHCCKTGTTDYNYSCEEAYEIGAASRQAEIDELEMTGIALQCRVDELQNRIDVLSKNVNEMAKILIDDVEEILKGEEND